MFMGWPVLNWGEGWGASGMGRIDRWCVALGNSDGVVSSDLLKGHAVADGRRGPTGIEFGTTGFGVWATFAEQVSLTVGTWVRGVAPSLMLTMGLVKKTPTPLPGACLTMPMRSGSRVVNGIRISFIESNRLHRIHVIAWLSSYQKIKCLQDMQR